MPIFVRKILTLSAISICDRKLNEQTIFTVDPQFFDIRTRFWKTFIYCMIIFGTEYSISIWLITLDFRWGLLCYFESIVWLGRIYSALQVLQLQQLKRQFLQCANCSLSYQAYRFQVLVLCLTGFYKKYKYGPKHLNNFSSYETPTSPLKTKYYTVVTPGLLQKMSKKCNSPGEFPGLVVFLAVFFRKFDKKSQNVTVWV